MLGRDCTVWVNIQTSKFDCLIFREVRDVQFLQEKISNKSAKELFDYCQKAEQDYRHFLSGRIQRFLALYDGQNRREFYDQFSTYQADR